MNNAKRFNLFVFLTMLAKLCVDLYLPVVLYQNNFSISYIMIFLIFSFSLNILIAIITTKIGDKIGFKYLLIFSLVFFILFYILISYINKNLMYIGLLIVINSLSNTIYYLARHNYASIILAEEDKTSGVGSVVIMNILASMVSAILSALFLGKLNLLAISIIVSFIYLFGCISIFKVDNQASEDKASLKQVNQKLDYKFKLFYLLEQFKVIFFILYPLYTYIYVQNTFTFISLVYFITSIASCIFIYVYTHFFKPNNYLKLSGVLLSITLFLDLLGLNKYIILIIVFFEGIFTKFYEFSITKIMYESQSDLKSSSYFLYMEILYEVGRIFILLGFYILGFKLKTILNICVIFILISSFMNLNSKKS